MKKDFVWLVKKDFIQILILPLVKINLYRLIFTFDNLEFSNIYHLRLQSMVKNNSKKELEKKWKKTEQEEMKEESHQVDLKEGYEQDEEYEES